MLCLAFFNLKKITLKSVPQAIKLNMTKCFRQQNIPHLFLIC